MDSFMFMTTTGRAVTESVSPIDSSTVIKALGVRLGVEGVGAAVSAGRVVVSGVCYAVGVEVKVGEGAMISSRAGVGAGSGWAQAMATPNNRAISPRRRRVTMDVRK